MPDVRTRLGEVRERIAAAAAKSGREADAVTLVAVTKGVAAERIAPLLDAGVADLGENRVRELADKRGAVGEARWHYLGAIQRNKARALVGVELVHGLDRAEEAAALDAAAERAGTTVSVLVQVNVAGEASKAGVPTQGVARLLDALGAYPRVVPRGFMVMAPHVGDAEQVRWVFAHARALHERYGADRAMPGLSMGMTNDFEVAVEEGSTMVRIGRALFGERR